MTCIEDVLKKIRSKESAAESFDSILKWTFDVLERSNPSAFRDILYKLENLAYAIEPAQAIEIVKHMRPKGQMWSMDQVKTYLESKNITDNLTDWYLVMNMCYNDYYNTAKMYGLQNETDFYFNLSKDFIEDPDAEPHKVAKYFC